MKKAIIVATVASMIDLFNWDNIRILQGMGYEVDVACNFSSGSVTSPERVEEFYKELKECGVRAYNVPVPRKMSDIKNIIKSYKMIKELCDANGYDIVHCHSPIGGAVGRLAARDIRKLGAKVIYTAHGFHFFKGAPLRNWLLLYPAEYYLSKATDILITINKEDYQRASSSFKAKKVEYIQGVGIDNKRFSTAIIDRSSKRQEIGVPEDSFLILSIGELNKNKNHEVVIKALGKLNNPKISYAICGHGPLEDHLKSLISKLNLEKQVKLLGYRQDISEITKASDLFAFMSYREGLSKAMMEAMASGLPVVCSRIRGNTDLIEEGQGGYLMEPQDVEELASKINAIFTEANLKESMGSFNLSKIKEFDITNVNRLMKNIYMANKSTSSKPIPEKC